MREGVGRGASPPRSCARSAVFTRDRGHLHREPCRMRAGGARADDAGAPRRRGPPRPVRLLLPGHAGGLAARVPRGSRLGLDVSALRLRRVRGGLRPRAFERCEGERRRRPRPRRKRARARGVHGLHGGSGGAGPRIARPRGGACVAWCQESTRVGRVEELRLSVGRARTRDRAITGPCCDTLARVKREDFRLGEIGSEQAYEAARIQALSYHDRIVEALAITQAFVPHGASRRLQGLFALVDRRTGEVSLGRWARRRTTRRAKSDV